MKLARVMAMVLILGTLNLGGAAFAADPAAAKKDDARMHWWREARFGMFIHWGLYAVPAGEWQGKEVKSIGEWIMNNAAIPVSDYEKLAQDFNPARFDAAEWVRIAKDAGMKYIVITTKHHDGFCMFDTKATDYSIVKATPYGKDVLRALSRECKRQGVKFCTYYSIMDWHHPSQFPGKSKTGGLAYNPSQMHPERKAEYIAYMKQQLRELISNYDTAVLWFDGEWCDWWTEADGKDLYAFLRKLKPSLIVNNRVGKGRKGMEGMSTSAEYCGDFGTPEQQIPPSGFPGVDWESCMTMNDTWGFKRNDDHWKSRQQLIRNLADAASKGGNFLLNVGPTSGGLIPPPSVERLEAVGRWMKVNSEAIYDTKASPFEKQLPWGSVTRKSDRLYLHVFDWPAEHKLFLPPVQGKVTGAYLLADPNKRALEVSQTKTEVKIVVPSVAPDTNDSVVVMKIHGGSK